jgi:hypothetical protein
MGWWAGGRAVGGWVPLGWWVGGPAGRQAVFNWVHASRGLLSRLPDSVDYDFNVVGLSRNLPPSLHGANDHRPNEAPD